MNTLIEVLGDIKIGKVFDFTCPKCNKTFKAESDMDIPECFDCAWDDLEVLKEILSPF